VIPRQPKEVADLAGCGVVLIIDDEQIVRSMAQQALENYGYTVLLAENGERGLDLFYTAAHNSRDITINKKESDRPGSVGDATASLQRRA
jgi:two-component system cell cycle sensor histidine kinase/response regulator CckA